MVTVVLALLATALLSTAVFARQQIARFTRGAGSVLLTRLVLLVVGLAFGAVSMRYGQTPVDRALMFAVGFGLVHLPAAMILLIKRARGAGRT